MLSGSDIADRPRQVIPHGGRPDATPCPPETRIMAPESSADEQLMLNYAAGDLSAFDRLYQRHRGPLYRYFLRQVSDPSSANDLYQGVWEKVIRARGRYRPQAKFSTWLYRIAHNHLVDHYRRQRPAESYDEGTTAVPREVLVETMPDDRLAADQTRQALQAAIQDLPAEQRETLLLKLEHPMTLEDIAEVTGVNRETVKSRLRYATAKLKKVMTS